jgi:hypothetical protein
VKDLNAIRYSQRYGSIPTCRDFVPNYGTQHSLERCLLGSHTNGINIRASSRLEADSAGEPDEGHERFYQWIFTNLTTADNFFQSKVKLGIIIKYN